MQQLIPSAARLLAHRSGDTRVVVTSALRRMLPGALQACVALSASNGGGGGQAADAVLHLSLSSVSEVVTQCPHLLGDRAPIPQYIVRLLIEVMRITPLFAHTVVQSLQQSGTLDILVRMLRQDAQLTIAGGNHDEDSGVDATDPQLAVLLRNVFETSEGSAALLQCDLATSLVTALIAAVYGTMNDTQAAPGSTPSSAPSPASAMTASTHETIILLVDLLHVVLHFVIRALSTADEKDAQLARQQQQHQRGTAAVSPPKGAGPHFIQAETFRRQVAPLRAVSPALLLIFSYVSNFLLAHDQQPRGRHGGNANNDVEDDEASIESSNASLAAYSHLIESSSRCLGILFDLFPDAVTGQLLSKLSILLDGGGGGSGAGAGESSGSPRKQAQQQAMYPRAVLANVVSNPQVHYHERPRGNSLCLPRLKISPFSFS